MSCNLLVVCFFFQAEDGIRDLVRSRGLGDVYKRQGKVKKFGRSIGRRDHVKKAFVALKPGQELNFSGAVSYTHLTLPTSDLV